MLGYVPEVRIGGTAYAQTSPILIYLSKQGKMDKLNELEELKSGMMLETVTEVFLGQGRNYMKYFSTYELHCTYELYQKSIRPITLTRVTFIRKLPLVPESYRTGLNYKAEK